MGLLDRFANVAQHYENIKSCGGNPFAVQMEKLLSTTEAIINGRPTLLAGTNNYLGLTFNQECINEAKQALDHYGSGTTGSRVANGSYGTHQALEEDLADFYGKKYAMIFTTGYQANLGIISALAGPNDFLILDADSHASIYDAAKLGQATVIRFKHNDPVDLEKRLARLADQPGNKLIVTEGIYSMLGDQAPLEEFVKIKKKYGAYLLVDEAHSLGVLGDKGRGLCEAAGVEDDVDYIVGTFSKSFGAIGGFCVSNDPQFDLLRVVSRPYMFTASLPPATIASVHTALKIVRQHPELRIRLWNNAHFLYDGLKHQGFQLGPVKSPVVAVYLPSPELAVVMWKQLLDSGLYVNLALPPATPQGTALLRCSVCSAHERHQLETMIKIMTEVAYKVGYMLDSAAVA
ncbi:MAG: aminotransferase class I/II-fold pyridoxal phosphate-dependent enzyme [Alphaproteobacteria bacterium]|nr:aminotransferase class I/II-fold pyridoxal phosphate-dependent enzyme [Alphaproteobacteria bacterium]